MSTTNDYFAHVEELIRRMDEGDEFATKSVAALALLISGWRPGDPDPTDDPDDDGGEPLPNVRAILRLVA